MGELDGVFIASKEEVAEMDGEKVNFGECLGKHSEVWFDEFDVAKCITEITDDQKVVGIMEKHGLTSGFNPLHYIQYKCATCEESWEDDREGSLTCCK